MLSAPHNGAGSQPRGSSGSCSHWRSASGEFSAARSNSPRQVERHATVGPLAVSGLGVGRLAPLAGAAHNYAIDPGADQGGEDEDEDQRTARAADDPVDLDVAQIDERECQPDRGEDEAGDQTRSVA